MSDSFILSVLNATPVLGHVKGAIHYLLDDKHGGDKAMKSATHTFGVVVGGAFGMFLSGSVGACVGGLSGGVIIDAGITLVDSKLNNEDRRYGYFEYCKKITDHKMTMYDWLAFANSTVSDCVIGDMTAILRKRRSASSKKDNGQNPIAALDYIGQGIAVCVELMLPAFLSWASETGELYVWKADGNSWGHASLSLHGGLTYISFYPREKSTHFFTFNKTEKRIIRLPASYDEDVKLFTLRPYTNKFIFSCKMIDTAKIRSWWTDKKRNGKYNLFLIIAARPL